MSDHPDLVVLVRTLEPSDELGSTLELLSWIHATRPQVSVRLVATQGGAWTDRAAAVAQLRVVDDALAGRSARALLRAGVAPAAQAARSAGLRHDLRTGAAPVLVDASAGALLNWLDDGAARVVAHLGRSGPRLDDLPEQDRSALERRATHWAEDMDLLPQEGDRDDGSDVASRCRAELDRDLDLVAGAPLVLVGCGPYEALPSDALLSLTWDLVASQRGVRVLWATEALHPPARAAVARHVADAGLHGVVMPIEAGPDLWRRVAAADAVVTHHDPSAAGHLDALARTIAAARTFTWGAPTCPATPDLAAIEAVLPGGRSWAPPVEGWHAATGGPAWLQLLGLDLPVA